MGQVPVIRTPTTPERAQSLIEEAWAARSARRPDVPGPDPERVALLLALWDLETGTGGQHRNHNFGNQIATRDDQDFYIADDSGNTRRFRAYPNGEAGAASFVAQLTSDTRPQWTAGLATGDPEEFVRSLKGLNGGPEYFEAPFERYLNTFMGRWERYAPKASPPRRGTEPRPPSSTGRRGSSLVLLSITVSALAAFLYFAKAPPTRR